MGNRVEVEQQRSPAFHIPGLDGIRAIAFMLVYFSHMHLGRSYTGGTGVALFFFLSGYLITTLLIKEHSKNGRVSLRAFYVRRAFRILPPLFVAVALAGALYAVGLNDNYSLPGVMAVLFYYANYWMISGHHLGWLANTWSLAIEEHFYIVFPLLFVFLKRFSKQTMVSTLCTMCGLALLIRMVLAYVFHASGDRIYLATDTRFDGILWGCLFAICYEPASRWMAKLASPRLMTVFAVLVAVGIDHVPVVQRAISYTVFGVACWMIFWAATTQPWMGWLNAGWLRLVGKWSYALYLIHIMVIDATAETTKLSPTLAAILAIPVCLAAAWAIELAVERPAQNMRNSLLRKLGPKLSSKEASTMTASSREVAN